MNKTNVNQDVSIQTRLNKGFLKVSGIVSIAAIIGIAAILLISWRYQRVLNYFAFPQGDIGQAMTEFAEARSALRAAIGYEDKSLIQEQHDLFFEHKKAFYTHMSQVEDTMISEEGKAAYADIIETLDEYWVMAEDILEQGSVTDRAICAIAQDRAAGDLRPLYLEIEEDLSYLMEINIIKGDDKNISDDCMILTYYTPLAKSFLQNTSSVPLRSAIVTPLSTTRPSI